ncbi:MAG TPA: ABC transporter substrate-binding protein [Candidatus Obscuribacterales bacterium]
MLSCGINRGGTNFLSNVNVDVLHWGAFDGILLLPASENNTVNLKDRKIVIGLLTAVMTAASCNLSTCAADSSTSRHNQVSGRKIAAAPAESEPIKIGFVTSQTGAAAPSARYNVNGIELWLEQIHHRIAGRKVELLIENDESSPATMKAKVRKLIEEDKVQIIDGFVLANVGYAAAPLADHYQIPFVYTTAASDDLTQRQHFNWIVRTGWTSSQPTQPFGDYAYKKLGYRRIATLGMDYAFGYEQVGGFQRAFEDAGGKVIQKIWAPLGFQDFTSFIKDIHKDADAVFICTFGRAAEIFPKQYKDVGPKLPLLAGGSAFDESILDTLGDEAVGALSSLSYSAVLTNPANKKLAAAYRAKYNEEPNWYSDTGYTSGLFIQQAIESLHGDTSDKAKLLAALKKVELKEAPRGPVKLDNHANPIENVYVRRVERKNGKLQNTVVDTFPMVSQFYKWPEAEFLAQPVYSKDYPPCKYCATPSK